MSQSFLSEWTPLRQWLIPAVLLAFSCGMLGMGGNAHWAYYAVFVSLLLLACTNPVVNAVRPNFRRNLAWSLPLFALHAGASYLLIQWSATKGEPINFQFFHAIIIFYGMATFLSALFRGIYILLKDM